MNRVIYDGQPDGWQGVHLLQCTHSFNSRSQKDYLMYCDVLKTMPDGRLKIRVYGRLYKSVEGGRIRYVDKWRICPAEKWGVMKS